VAILSASDFKSGRVKLASSQTDVANLTALISSDWENKQIRRMLGATEGDAFIADLVAGVPQTAKYITIFNSFEFEIANWPYSCAGIKEILKYLFYYYFTQEQSTFNSSAGDKSLNIEASNDLFISKGMRLRNRASSEVTYLQRYCLDNSDTYTDFEVVYQYPYLSPI